MVVVSYWRRNDDRDLGTHHAAQARALFSITQRGFFPDDSFGKFLAYGIPLPLAEEPQVEVKRHHYAT